MGNRERLARLRYLGEQLALPPTQRDTSLPTALRDVLFDINVVLEGADVSGSFRPQRCCLIGAAMLDRWFNDHGLTHSAPFSDNGHPGDERCAPVLNGLEVPVSGRDLAQWFEVPVDVYKHLVLPGGYYDDRDDDPTPSQVIARLDEIMARNTLIA
jgi:hypothetical protein